MDQVKNTFEELSSINLNTKVKEKIGLKYLGWAYAWEELKKYDPEADWTIYTRKVQTTETIVSKINENDTKTVQHTYEDELPYFSDGHTCFVKVGVTVRGKEYTELLPVMDNKNNAVRLEAVTTVYINKALQRAFVKAAARHGLGLYLYAGEDLPESERVVIDYAGLMSRADNSAKPVITEDEFNKLKQDSINMIQNNQDLDGTAQDNLFNYTGKLFPNKRLSVLTYAEDAENIQKLHFFLCNLLSLLHPEKK